MDPPISSGTENRVDFGLDQYQSHSLAARRKKRNNWISILLQGWSLLRGNCQGKIHNVVRIWISPSNVHWRILSYSLREGEREPRAGSDLICKPLGTSLVQYIEPVIVLMRGVTKHCLFQLAGFLKQMFAAGVIRHGGVMGK